MLSDSRAFVAYEMLDIPPIQVGRGLWSLVLRAVERLCLTRIGVSGAVLARLPCTTIFCPCKRYDGTWFLLENKVHLSALNRQRQAPARPKGRE